LGIPWIKPVIDEEMKSACLNALSNEKLVMGESVLKFEEEFARFCGVSHAVSTSSGTDALIITLNGLGLEGKKVLTTPASFVATANSVIYAGATPVFADARKDDYSLDPGEVRKKSGFSALLPVHLYGHPARMNELNEIALSKGIPVIEDACQAHGAEYEGRKAGSLATAGCFSFYPTKNLTVAGDGGMITTNDSALAKKAAKIRDCGRASQYEHDVLGRTSRLNTVNAAIGRIQLKRLDSWNEARKRLALKYFGSLKNVDEIILPPMPSRSVQPVYHLFPIMTQRRNELKEFLQKRGIGTGTNYPVPIHLQPLYREKFGYKKGDFPVAEKISDEVLCLPMFVELKSEELNAVCEAVKDFFSGKREAET